MALLETPLNRVTEADLVALISAQTPESMRIDYKRQSYGQKESDRTEFLKDILVDNGVRGAGFLQQELLREAG